MTRFLIFSFGFMVAFSIYLHNHEFDPFAADEDCAPCHWSQTATSLDIDIPDLNVTSWVRSISVKSEHLLFPKSIHTYFGRSPPLLFS